MSFEIKEGAFIYINGQPIVFPRDSNFYPISFIFALTEDGNRLVPVKVTSDGKLICSTEIGTVEIIDNETNLKLNIKLEGQPFENSKGIVIFGKDEEGNVKGFLIDLQGNLKVHDFNLNIPLSEIKTSLYDIFDGTKTLGWIKRKPDYSEWHALTDQYTLSRNATKTVTIDIPSNEKWHLETIVVSTIPGTVVSSFSFELVPKNQPIKSLGTFTTNGPSVAIPIYLTVDGITTRSLRITIKNGDVNANTHYFSVIYYKETI